MDVNLSIYDLRGRLVDQLVNEFQNDTSIHCTDIQLIIWIELQ